MLFFTHFLYCLFGLNLLAIANNREDDVLALQFPHLLAGYFLGLIGNCILAFIANQFWHLQITPLLLCQQALLLLLLTCLLKPKLLFPKNNSANLSILEITLLLLALAIFVSRHLSLLRSPLSDWDSLFYHLTFGREISLGNFPSNFGPSYNLKMEAAYPPLFYFIYGMHFFAFKNSSVFFIPKITLLFFNAVICIMSYYFPRNIFKLNKTCSLLVLCCIAITISNAPNIQSATTIYLLFALYFFMQIFSSKGKKNNFENYLVIGLFWSGVYWSSYTGLVIVFLFWFSFFLLKSCKRFFPKISDIQHVKVLLPAIIIFILLLPHLLRNYLAIGNPIFPGLLNIIGGKGVTEWVLKNREVVVPINIDFYDLGKLFCDNLPHSGILIASIALVCLWHPLNFLWRFAFIVLFCGYIVFWVKFFQLKNTPSIRFLFPLTPCAVYLIFVNFYHNLCQRLKQYFEKFPCSVSIVRPLGKINTAVALAVTTSCVIFILAINTNWTAVCDYESKIKINIEWMNKHLPKNAVVLTMECQLFALKRKIFPGNDYRLEKFYKAKTNKQSMQELKKFAITHIFITRNNSSWQPFKNKVKDLVWPLADIYCGKVVHFNKLGMTIKLVKHK